MTEFSQHTYSSILHITQLPTCLGLHSAYIDIDIILHTTTISHYIINLILPTLHRAQELHFIKQI